MTRPIAIVTGASEGIGRGFAEALAAKGHDVLAVARDEKRLIELKADLEGRHSIEVRALSQDLGATGAVEAIRAAAAGRPIACLVNNAGFQVPIGTFADSRIDDVDSMIAVNVVAVTNLTHALLPAVIAARGAIINVASHAAFQPVPYMAAYAATKAYVLHFTEALADELHASDPGSVYVMALCPGATKTQFWTRSGSPVEKTRFSVMSVDEVVGVAMEALERRRGTVVIPSLLLRLATQSLRLSTRSLTLKLARMLTGYRPGAAS